MKRQALWKISLATSGEAEEAVAELLSAAFGQPATSYTDLETGLVTVSAYFGNKPNWTCAKRNAFQDGLRILQQSGLRFPPSRLKLSRLPRRDWAEVWKRHFQPLTIGSSLLLKPSWSRPRARPGQAVVVLDPGLSFGTGQHPTTAFCLRQLVSCRDKRRAQSFLDLGTGSGILAIAAAKLRYAPVVALDFDPDAVRVALSNARRNRLVERIQVRRADLTRLPLRSRPKYSLVCANLLSSLLVAERDRILARLDRQGRLVVAGILKEEFRQVQKAYEAAGLRLVASRTEKEWRSGSFCWQ